MAEEASATGRPTGQKKPSPLAQAAKALSQLGLTFFVLLLFLALLSTAGREPGIAILMAVCAVVPLLFGPGWYRAIGVAALVIAGGFYASSQPLPKRAEAPAPPLAAVAAARQPHGASLRATPAPGLAAE